jgi:hypothetical protein
MFKQFEALLQRKNQRFVCTDNFWPRPGPDYFTASIEHEVGHPLDDATLCRVAAQVGNLPELIEFYRRYGFARLFRDTKYTDLIGYASAFYIAPPDAWPDLRISFTDWLDGLEEEEWLPSWLDNYVVIGEIPKSGNSFLLPLAGPEHGKVYEFEHDGMEFIKRGKNLADFLNSISTVTDDLLAKIRGHTRYSDGKTDTQWMCIEYIYD